MKEISVILKEMRDSMTETRESFDHKEFVKYLEKYKESYTASPEKINSVDLAYTTAKFNIVSSKLLQSYDIRMRDILRGTGKKSSKKMHTEIKNLNDCFVDYVKLNMPEWYNLAEKSDKIKDIRAKTQEIMERV